MGKSYRYLLIALMLTGVLIIYHQFGGFNQPEISYVEEEGYYLVGKHYQGPLDDRKWESLFSEMRNLMEKDSLKGTLTIVWFEDPEIKKDTANAFVGIITAPDTRAPAGLEKQSILMRGVLRATIRAHAMVMPEPAEVVDQLRKYAAEQGYELRENILIEKYPQESLVITEIPVKNGTE